MKHIISFISFLFFSFISVAQTIDENAIQKAVISTSDSSLVLSSDIRKDHRIFGYENPDTSSRKLILISVFTDDVESNPFKCPLGAFYETARIPGTLKFISRHARFLKISFISKEGNIPAQYFYIEKKWAEFRD